MLVRSALAIKLLTSSRFGSIAAAGTFGLPEMVGGERNWDYRYTWIRDGSLTAAILVRLGFTDEPRAFLEWVEKRYSEANEPGKLQIMYGIDGRHDIAEAILGDLEGYRARRRCGSATRRTTSSSWTSTASSSTWSTCSTTRSRCRLRPLASARESVDWICGNWRSRTRASGRSAAGSRSSCTPGSCAGWRSTGAPHRPAPLAAVADRSLADIRDEIHDDIYDGFWDDGAPPSSSTRAAPRSTPPAC